ncbi:basic proline-rich protein-like [Eumetopias jubatus]|uniref:basic proline-rich protein-like n=1 Tax=Eumetopias jubatus TaxID=34886 RepID=UPI0010170363|nr:basic proline-rich protein-like [Eumetopias jubatus]
MAAGRSGSPPLPLGPAPERAAALCGRPGPSRAHLDSGPRSSCGPGSRYTPGRPPTAGPPRAASARLTARLQRAARRPALPPPSTARHRRPAACGDLGSARKYLSGPWPLDGDSSSSPPPTPGGAGQPLACSGTRSPPPPRDLFCSCQVAARSRGCLAAKSSHSFSFSCGPVRFAQNPVLFSIRSCLSDVCLLSHTVIKPCTLPSSSTLPGQTSFPSFQ